MVYTTIDKLSEVMVEKNLPYFRVLDPNKERIYDNDDSEVAKASESCEQLTNYLEELDGSFVLVKLSKTQFAGKNKGGDVQTGSYQYRVNLRSSRASKDGVGSTSGAHVSRKYDELLDRYHKLEMQVMISARDAEWDKKFKVLEEKIGESPLEKYAPMFLPIIGKLAGVNIPAAEVAGAEQTINGTETTAEPKADAKTTNERLKNACIRLMKVDKNFCDTLENLASFAEKKPEAYQQYIPMLKTMI